PEVRARGHHDVLHDVAERPAPLEHPVVQDAEVVLEEDERRGLLREVHGPVDGEPDVCRVQGGRVVDPVAKEANDGAPPPEGEDHACWASSILASVSVPVLSVQSTSMLPRSWIEARRLTITFFAAMRSAPRARQTETIIGSSSGVRPTASARANRNDSRRGRCRLVLMSTTVSTSRRGIRMTSRPKAWVPCSKAVAGGPGARV